MNIHILTLFPAMVMQGLNTSILGRAMEKKILSIDAVNIRDYTTDKHGKVDDYPYGGGAGMLMQAQPVYDAWKSVNDSENQLPGRKVRTIYVTPQGKTFDQRMAADFAKEEELIFLCGHYEGIDERVLEEIVTDYVSIGDYVLTGGELAAMVMIDAIARLVPGVLHNQVSAETESFHNDLLEYPQYSRPEEWHGKKVPMVLLSGNHNKIMEWRLQQSEERTSQRRPDLYRKYQQKQKVIKRLSKNKRANIHIMENLARGKGNLLFAEGDNVLVYDAESKLAMITVCDQVAGERMLEYIPEEVEMCITSQEFMNDPVCRRFSMVVRQECYQSCYTQRELLPVKHKDIRQLDVDALSYLAAHYDSTPKEYLLNRILAGAMYGAFVDGRLVGFAGIHREGSSGLLFVEEAFRRLGIGESLTAYIINCQRESGFTPFGHTIVGNDKSLALQQKLGLYVAKDTVWWLGRE